MEILQEMSKLGERLKQKIMKTNNNKQQGGTRGTVLGAAVVGARVGGVIGAVVGGGAVEGTRGGVVGGGDVVAGVIIGEKVEKLYREENTPPL